MGLNPCQAKRETTGMETASVAHYVCEKMVIKTIQVHDRAQGLGRNIKARIVNLWRRIKQEVYSK